MLEQQFLKLMLSHEFFMKNKHLISRKMFSEASEVIFDTLEFAHERYGIDIKESELVGLINSRFPTLSSGARHNIQELCTSVAQIETINDTIASDILSSILRREKAREIGELSVKALKGEETFGLIADVLATVPRDLQEEEFALCTTDIDELIDLNKLTTKWQFNIPALAAVVPGVGPGNQVIIFGRPEVGKTASMSLVYGPGGFCAQGATVLHISNEEPIYRTILRAACCYSNVLFDEHERRREEIRASFNSIRGKIFAYSAAGADISFIRRKIEEIKPDITWIDQLDNVKISQEFQRDDLMLRALYVETREMAIKHNMAVFNLCQASAEAEGKRTLNLSMLDRSRTGKGATADLIFGIGRSPVEESGVDDPARCWNICKNKINGRHTPVYCMLDAQRTYYHD